MVNIHFCKAAMACAGGITTSLSETFFQNSVFCLKTPSTKSPAFLGWQEVHPHSALVPTGIAPAFCFLRVSRYQLHGILYETGSYLKGTDVVTVRTTLMLTAPAFWPWAAGGLWCDPEPQGWAFPVL